MKKILLGTALLFGTISGFAGSAQANDNYCREYTKTITIGDQKEVGYGTACLQPDGSWEVVSEDKQANLKSYKTSATRKVVYQPVVINTQKRHYKGRYKKNSRNHYRSSHNNYRQQGFQFVWR